MLQLTKRTEYGLIALTHLAAREGEVVSVREIAESYPVSRRLLGEALKALCRSRLVESHRGASGGYSLGRPADSIHVGEVVAVLEGAPSVASCESLGAYTAGGCEVEPVCPIRSPIQKLKSGIWGLLRTTSIRDLLPTPENVPSGSGQG